MQPNTASSGAPQSKGELRFVRHLALSPKVQTKQSIKTKCWELDTFYRNVQSRCSIHTANNPRTGPLSSPPKCPPMFIYFRFGQVGGPSRRDLPGVARIRRSRSNHFGRTGILPNHHPATPMLHHFVFSFVDESTDQANASSALGKGGSDGGSAIRLLWAFPAVRGLKLQGISTVNAPAVQPP